MNKTKLLSSLILVMTLIIVSGCGENYGQKLEFNGGELYYTSSVTSSEANKLGQYLVKVNFFNGDNKAVQLNKTGSTYEYRMVVKKGMENDEEFIKIAKGMAKDLSSNVFGGNPVDIHLCDDHLKTLRVVVPL
jgi:hypothetical protein